MPICHIPEMIVKAECHGMNKHWKTIEQLALDLGQKPVTVRKWKSRGRVPYWIRLDILDRAKAKRQKLPREAFDS